MFAGLFKRSRAHEVPQELYGSVVAQARLPVFFTDFGFEDTVTGRFDVILLHLFLLSRRLVREDTPLSQSLNQEIFDHFTEETDRALRELGVGDTTVPKRKKKMIHSFYALVQDLSEPLDGSDREKLAQLVNSRFAKGENQGLEIAHKDIHFNVGALVNYILETSKSLDAFPVARILAGELEWPKPEKYV